MSETRSSHVLSIVRSLQRPVLIPAMLLASSSVLLLSGCGSSFNLGQGPAGPADIAELHGTVHGGQTAVTGATVSMYEIGATATTAGGYAAAVPAALGTATTDVNGNWSMSPHACVNANDELYLVASDGMAIGNTTANSALVLTSIGGTCGAQFTHNWDIDEVTTVATEYALSGFSTGYLAVGTTTTNTIGLTHAFATVNNIVSLSGGSAYSATPAYVSAPASTSPDIFRSIVPNDLINSIANSLSSCVNAPLGAADPACTALFALTPGASTTADAALYVAHNPGLQQAGVSQVGTFLALAPPVGAPFGPTVSTTPNDLALSVNYVSGGLGGTNTKNRSSAEFIAIDQNGNVWIPNAARASVTELDYLGEPLSPTGTVNTALGTSLTLGGYGGTATGSVGFVSGDPRGIAIDQNGNAWIADSANCLIGLAQGGTPLTGNPFTGVCGGNVDAVGVSVDASNNVWVVGAEAGASFISAAANGSTSPLSGFPVTSGFDTLSGFSGADYAGHTWYVDQGNGEVGALNINGSSYTTSGSFLSSPVGYSAFDKVGSTITLWIPEAGGSNNVETATLSPLPPAAGPAYLPASELGPGGIAADGASNVVIGMEGNPPTLEPNLTVLTSSGTAVAGENADTGYQGGSGLMALVQTQGLSIDQSGNVWVVSQSNWNNKANPVSTAYTNSNGISYLANVTGAAVVTEYIGLSAPAQPVLSLSAKAGATSGVSAAGAYGVKP